MDVTLIMFRDGGDHRPFEVTKAATLIGRREDCDLRIAVSDVSRKHSRLTLDGDELEIEDLGSSNGTFVNGKKVDRSPLKAGDVLKIGPVTFVVQVDGSPGSDSVAGLVQHSVAPKRPATPTSAKPASIDDEIDELSILNDSSADSGIGSGLDLSDDDTRQR